MQLPGLIELRKTISREKLATLAISNEKLPTSGLLSLREIKAILQAEPL